MLCRDQRRHSQRFEQAAEEEEEEEEKKEEEEDCRFSASSRSLPEALTMADSPPSASLIDRYVEACEKHGRSPNIDMHIAISKAKSQQSGVLKLFLEQLTDADMMPLVDFFPFVENSGLEAVDVVHNKETSNGQVLLRILRLIGPKLRLVDLKKISFGRETLRDLFHRGMQCQVLDLSFSRARKLDMTGQFPQLHTLFLDFSIYLTSLPEGCFRAMPNLASLSMCETRVANLWTTCAALSKISSLVELRFQSCRCCEGTGQCAALVTSEKPYYTSEEGTRIKHLGNLWHMDWTPMNIDDLVSLDSERSDSSITDDDTDDLFSDDDSAMMLQHVHTSSEDSSGDSDAEQEEPLLETTSLEDDLNYQGDAEYDRDHAIDVGDAQGEQGMKEDCNETICRLLESADDGRESISAVKSEQDVLCLGESSHGGAIVHEQASSGSSVTGDVRQNLGQTSLESYESRSRLDNSHEGEELQLSTTVHRTMSLRRGRSHHPSRICYEKYYREFMIARLPGLKVLDNLPVTQMEREKAHLVFMDKFETLPNNRSERESIIEVLKRRETLSWATAGPYSKRRRVGIVGKSQNGIAFSRSMCALKMASCTWPSCVPICRLKKSNSELNRKCRPRQFEYHPTDPSLMVFGTLHGEVVVVNHESDKVIGHVQSNGSSHSILGLCWLNKDPNKLIAGSDHGSLQLFDVNRMRSTTNLSGDSLGFGNRNSGGNYGRTRRNPAIYTYDNFEQLTSVHINCTDEYFLASGYSRDVGLYDLRTGKQLQIFHDLHQQHINVVKFAHHSPHLFATSSFDREIKMWDLRQKVSRPLYTVRSTGGNVMVCFSRDDHFLLSSAVDNEVRQHLAVDGKPHMKFDIPRAGSGQNYTRSYYMNGRDYIITGSCEENVVRIYCAQTGRRLRDLALEGRGSKTSIYVQSLRGDPFRDFHFSVLAAYFRPHPKSEILKVNLLGSNIQKKTYDFEAQHKLPAGMGA